MAEDPGIQDLARRWAAAQPVVAAFISLMVEDFHDAQDVLQDVAAAVLSHDHAGGAPRSFNAWAIGIARHKAIDFHRRMSVEPIVFDSESLDHIAEAYEALSNESDDRREALEHCLKRVGAKSKAILNLRYEDGLKPIQIARKLGIGDVGAVRVALHRIRMALRDCIERRTARGETLP